MAAAVSAAEEDREAPVDLFSIAALAIAGVASAVLAMGYCLWCLLDEPAEGDRR